MAVKTLFTTEDFWQILSNYDLGEFKNSSPFKAGAVQTNMLLETSKGQAVLRYYESRTETYARFEMNVLEYLKRRDYPCAAPLRNKQGEYLGNCYGKPFALLECLEGEHSKSEGNGPQIAEALAKLHTLTLGYRPDCAEVRDSYDPVSCLRNATANIQKIASKLEAENRLTWLKKELAKLGFPENLPKGVCQCDTHPSNFLYKDDKLVAVLDFDDASYVYLLYDVANLLFFWAWPDKGELDFEQAKELLRVYEQHRQLTEEEKRHLFDVLHMVNFMGIGWFIHEDADYHNSRRKTEFLNSLGRAAFYNRIFQSGSDVWTR
jgi:homoserine kinase type II